MAKIVQSCFSVRIVDKVEQCVARYASSHSNIVAHGYCQTKHHGKTMHYLNPTG